MTAEFNLFQNKMKNDGIGDDVIAAFEYLYGKLAAGELGKLGKNIVSPPDPQKITRYNDLPVADNAPWEKLAVIKLNGGLGTSMGLNKAKSLLKVKDGFSFLEVIARQIMQLRNSHKAHLPLLLMDSFNTSQDSLRHLQKFPELITDNLPLDFIQNKFPKVKKDDLTPLENEDDKKNWNPPGHGEIYMVLKQTGVLKQLLDKGYRYIFISNSDNLGAIADARILQYMAANNIPFIMEVCLRTEMDKKGGHLAQDNSGKLILRESAQCPDNEIELFQNINLFKYFNTNNLWVDLVALSHLLDKYGFLHLTPIMNNKIVDGQPVIQLETAMGAAINVFAGSQAVVVDRNRFVPVKKTNEFLAVRSDAYMLDDNWNIKLAPGKKAAPQIHLDEKYYKTITDFDEKFPLQYPSLKECTSLNVKGNVYFGNNVKIKGKVNISTSTQATISDTTICDSDYNLD